MNNNAKILSLAALYVLLTLQHAFASTAVTRLTDIDGSSVIIVVCLVAWLFVLLSGELRKNRH